MIYSLVHINVVIIIYLGGIYSSDISSKEGTQGYCFDFSTERNQSRHC